MFSPGVRPVCVSVCLSVCVCVSVIGFCSHTLRPILMKIHTNHFNKYWGGTSLIFWKFYFNEVITAFLMFSFASLSLVFNLCSIVFQLAYHVFQDMTLNRWWQIWLFLFKSVAPLSNKITEKNGNIGNFEFALRHSWFEWLY